MRNIDKTIEIGKSYSLWRTSLLITSPTNSHVFPAGADVIIPIMKIHMRPDLWPDTWQFDPDRFLPEQVEKRHWCAFLPFGHGSRICIGE
jgi:cytochrome P450